MKITKEFLTFKEIHEKFKKEPPKKFLWGCIKEGGFGLIFGPSKSGKSIFAENFAKMIVTGAGEFMGISLDGKPKKVLFMGLEEYWGSRVERNREQYKTLNLAEKKLYEENYLYQPIEYLTLITTKKHWKKLKCTIESSKAAVVIIDSITRMNHGNIEDSKVAQDIMQNLRTICYDLGITLICIHHTPKMYGKPLTIDSIKGSSVFAQESDFAIGINATRNYKTRYFKEIFSRYSSINNDNVLEFEIDNSTCIKNLGKKDEYNLLNGEDYRKLGKGEEILNYFRKHSCKKFKTAELVKNLCKLLSVQERMIKIYLKDLLVEGKISQNERGTYYLSECKDKLGKEEGDEK
ncbi:helicase RepA family protein [Lutibacter sp. A80]|uniref:AAA family ATPase n=1 Tax=Lutibacter sp. A80 TaxID=2918453 RepID=UPI001F058BA8|nr:AAA family ATPase [Lutibacter sp. A80]UMB59910.1 helicase RepA family protein [Lutibacter sp. A80]